MEITETQDTAAGVPVTVDAVKNNPGFCMTRCTYLTVESSGPTPGWILRLQDADIPFVMLGLSVVITSPPGGAACFDKPEQLDRLFDAVERKQELYVDTNDIWLPNTLFTGSGNEPQRGNVYRVGFDLFRVACLLRDEINTDREFLDRLAEWDVPVKVEASDSETEALMQWNRGQIEINREHYHASPGKKLNKKPGFENPHKPMT